MIRIDAGAGTPLIHRRELTAADGDSAEVTEYGDLQLDPACHECRWKEHKLPLTVTEFLIVDKRDRGNDVRSEGYRENESY